MRPLYRSAATPVKKKRGFPLDKLLCSCYLNCTNTVNTVRTPTQEVVFTININYRDPRPIYEQVRDGLRTLIVSGALASGEKLPSVRELASSLSINPNTIQRAYRELEQEGYLYSVPGKGSFAAERAGIDTQRRDALLRRFDETVRELKYLGVSAEALYARMEKGEDEPC